MPVDDYPELVHKKKYGAVIFWVKSYLKDPNDKLYKPLDKIESLLQGLNEELAMACHFLVSKKSKKRMMEAKGIYDRNNLTPNDFKFKGGKNQEGIAF